MLLPVVALGRAQELLLILEEYWSRHPELHGVPIYQAGPRLSPYSFTFSPFSFKAISNGKRGWQIGLPPSRPSVVSGFLGLVREEEETESRGRRLRVGRCSGARVSRVPLFLGLHRGQPPCRWELPPCWRRWRR